jgi:hypothetical protein
MSPRYRPAPLLVLALAALAAVWIGARPAIADLIQGPEAEIERPARRPVTPQSRGLLSPAEQQDLYRADEEPPTSAWRENLLPVLMLAGVGGVFGLVVLGSVARRHTPQGQRGRGSRRSHSRGGHPTRPADGHIPLATLMTMLGNQDGEARRTSSERSGSSSGHRSSRRRVRHIRPLREYDNDM